MATTSPSTPAPAAKPFCPIERLKPYLNAYYLTVAGVLGGITAAFAVVFVLLVIVATNCNVLGWVE